MTDYYLAGDICKEKIDFCLYDSEKYLLTRVVKNTKSDLKKFIKEIDALILDSEKAQLCKSLLFVFEYTGIYNNHILEILFELQHRVALIHPGTLKAVVKVDRNKTDEIDAKRIAEYAHRFRDKLDIVQPSSNELKELKILISERASLVKLRSQCVQKEEDYKNFMPTNTFVWLKNNNKALLEDMEEAIKNIDSKILTIIKSDQGLHTNYKNAVSVPGIGPVTAAALICFTGNFTKFKNSKQLGSYCGVVPFERSSGMYRGKQRVSKKANKHLKSLLHMGALSIMTSNNNFGRYYAKKVEEGKNKMAAINCLRNKILKTVFSCVMNKQKYKADFQFAFAA